MDRPCAECLDVGAGGVDAAGLLGDRLAEVAAPALVAVAHRLLAAADRVGEVLGREAGVAQEVLERKRAGRLAGEVLEEHAGGEALVELVRPVHDPGTAAVSVERKRAVRGFAPVEMEELELVGGLHPRSRASSWSTKTPKGPSAFGSAAFLHQGRSIPQSASGARFPMNTWCGG